MRFVGRVFCCVRSEPPLLQIKHLHICVSAASWWCLPWAASTDCILVHQFSGPELVCPAISSTRGAFSDLCSGIYCLFVSKVICSLAFLFGLTPSPVGRNGSQGDCYSLKLSLSMDSFADPYLSSLIKNSRGFDWYFQIVQVSSYYWGPMALLFFLSSSFHLFFPSFLPSSPLLSLSGGKRQKYIYTFLGKQTAVQWYTWNI